METVKTLLENTKKDLEMKLWWAEEYGKEPQHIEEIPTLKQKIADIDEVLLRLFSVVGQSEQLCRTFLPDGRTTIATKCQFCGKEKWEH